MKAFSILKKYLLPKGIWVVPAVIISGALFGVIMLLFEISNASSYLSDEPETCVNCHVMYSQYDSWRHSSHAHVASCNDCHVPQNNVVSKYYFKAMDGLRHATIFTLRGEEQVIQIKHAGLEVVQENCLRCHQDLVAMSDLADRVHTGAEVGFAKRCWDCHREVPHTRVNSLSSSPNAVVPYLKTSVPQWLKDYIEESTEKK